MADLLARILACLHYPNSIMMGSELRRYPEDEVRFACEQGWLQNIGAQSKILCPYCDGGHLADVVLGLGGDAQPAIACPISGWVSITKEEIQTYKVDAHAFAKSLQRELKLSGRLSPLGLDTAWMLGTDPTHRRKVVFATGLAFNNGPSIVARIGQEGRPIVLVPGPVPRESVGIPIMPSCVQVREICTMTAERLDIDVLALAARIKDADERSERMAGMRLNENELVSRIRKIGAAQSASQLTEDAIVGAYRQTGSCRKASEMLKSRGQTASPSTVHRVMKKHPDVQVSRAPSKHFEEGVPFQMRHRKQ